MDDDDEFRFNDASTHEGHLRQYGELTRFCSETIIMISHKLISGISNAQEFCRKNISVYAIFNGQSFNYMLTNDIVSFEQLGNDSLIFTSNDTQICWNFLLKKCE